MTKGAAGKRSRESDAMDRGVIVVLEVGRTSPSSARPVRLYWERSVGLGGKPERKRDTAITDRGSVPKVTHATRGQVSLLEVSRSFGRSGQVRAGDRILIGTESKVLRRLFARVRVLRAHNFVLVFIFLFPVECKSH